MMDRNHQLALQARDLLIDVLDIGPPAPDEMLGAMATVPLPDALGQSLPAQSTAIQKWLWEDHLIEAPVNVWPEWPQLLLRVSAQFYNRFEQYEGLAQAFAQRGPDQQNPG